MRKKPMLAQNVGDYSRIKDGDWPLYIQPKLDGVRCLIQYEQVDLDFDTKLNSGYKVKAYSRTGKEWKNIDHILEELVPFFTKYPNVILDGELYNHDLKDDFEKIISLVRKTKPTDEDRLESSEKVEFHCYDTVMEHMPFGGRDKFIRDNFGHYGKFELSTVVPTSSLLVFNTEQIESDHERFLEKGYEGSILRQNKPYECKRSWTLMKIKDFSDAEATIIGYEEGKGKREDHLGKFIMQDDDGIEFGCPPGKGYTYEDMKNMLENIHDYIGKRATFTYFQRTKAGSYRHPLFKAIRNYE
jgi:ATP-dependent DNA ligase